MANSNKTNGGVGDMLTKLDERAAELANLSNEAFLTDGEAILREIVEGEKPTGVLTRVVKLKQRASKAEPLQCLKGKFLGYEPVMVKAPGGGQEQLMNFVLIEVKPGLVGKILGSSQIMQGMASVQPGQTVSIIRPDGDAIDIGGGKRVTPFLVIPKVEAGNGVSGYTVPFGKWGSQYQLANQPRASALLNSGNVVEGEQVPPHDDVTGEVK